MSRQTKRKSHPHSGVHAHVCGDSRQDDVAHARRCQQQLQVYGGSKHQIRMSEDSGTTTPWTCWQHKLALHAFSSLASAVWGTNRNHNQTAASSRDDRPKWGHWRVRSSGTCGVERALAGLVHHRLSCNGSQLWDDLPTRLPHGQHPPAGALLPDARACGLQQ